MTARIAASMPPGRWLTVAEVQRRLAVAGREIWPRRNLSLRLSYMAKAGELQREESSEFTLFLKPVTHRAEVEEKAKQRPNAERLIAKQPREARFNFWSLDMTSDQFREARQTLGLSVAQLGRILNTDPRTVRRWESDDDPRPVNPIAARVMRWMLDGYKPPEWPLTPHNKRAHHTQGAG